MGADQPAVGNVDHTNAEVALPARAGGDKGPPGDEGLGAAPSLLVGFVFGAIAATAVAIAAAGFLSRDAGPDLRLFVVTTGVLVILFGLALLGVAGDQMRRALDRTPLDRYEAVGGARRTGLAAMLVLVLGAALVIAPLFAPAETDGDEKPEASATAEASAASSQ